MASPERPSNVRRLWRSAFGDVAAEKARGALTGGQIPAEIALPGRPPSVLALHGFGGTPFEVELVSDAAGALGLAALSPLLPGHGTHARDLAVTRFDDWMGAAEAAFDRLTRPVIVAGLSMGSLLALELSRRRPKEVIGLVLLANAVWLSAPFPCWALAVAERLSLPDFLAPKAGPDIGDGQSRQTHVSYDCHPLHAAIQVRRAGERARARLEQVRCPTLILHGAKDRVCPVANAWRVAERLGTDDRRVVVFPRSHHILTRDVERDAVRSELVAFFKRIANQ